MTKRLRKTIAAALCYACAAPFTFAQQSTAGTNAGIAPERPKTNVLARPYRPAIVPPVRLGDSTRLHDLIRGGKLYLTLQDALALALENNIDIEVSRYNQNSLEWQLERSQAGGALPGVPSNASQTSSVASGQGVLGSQAAAGVNVGNQNGGRAASNATVTQVGPVVQTFDPSLQQATTFSHRTIPFANAVQSATNILIQNQRIYTGSYQQGLATGGSVNVSYNNHYLNENAATDVLNPSVAPTLSVSIQHNLLQGFGRALNERNIEVARLNLGMSDLNFRSQVVSTVANVLNTYWALAGAYEDVKAKQSVVDTAQQFFNENKQRVELGALAPVDLPASESAIAAGRQNLVNSQAVVRQRELDMKNMISRRSLADPLLMSAQIVPLDRITIPEQDDLEPVKVLVDKAYANRSDILSQKAALKTSEVSALGTTNGVRPSLQVFSTMSNAGLAGTPRIVPNQGGPDPYFVGNIGSALGQIVRRNFPSESIGVFGNAKINNRQAQADDGITRLQYRQQQLSLQKDLNQVQVDISNSVVALRQARARYDAARENRILSEELAQAEEAKFKLGESTSYNVIVQQRDLAAAKANEISSLVSYQNARTNLDQTLGVTLEANNITLGEARAAKVNRVSVAPANQ